MVCFNARPQPRAPDAPLILLGASCERSNAVHKQRKHSFSLRFLTSPTEDHYAKKDTVGVSRHAKTASCVASWYCSLPRKADVLEIGAKGTHFCKN